MVLGNLDSLSMRHLNQRKIEQNKTFTNSTAEKWDCSTMKDGTLEHWPRSLMEWKLEGQHGLGPLICVSLRSTDNIL